MNDNGLWTDGHDRQWPSQPMASWRHPSISYSVCRSAGPACRCVRTEHGAWTRMLYPCRSRIDPPEDPILSAVSRGSCQAPGCRLESRGTARHGRMSPESPSAATSRRSPLAWGHWVGVGRHL
ncbi:hypothetical protein BDA96_10G307600 [Sorghum bicolor]|uniref:Uncharacterized protein n=1 Tax=Sorghum bicolor TaxID=4558 RepID=A0A921U2M7_SORBI|nr:hypothetical protein BDA96_10G307600 [Sorghum bicolor]